MAATVHVVAGFLGAGKTTVLQHLLASLPPGRIGLVVNDFGEAAIDKEILQVDGAGIREIRGSCVCCTAPEGFLGAVNDLVTSGGVDRVFVEPTGLARPADLIDTLRRAPSASLYDPAPLIVVVDPGRIVRGELDDDVLAQVGVADVLIANRVDLATELELELFRSWTESLWPGPHVILETQFGRVSADDVLAWPAGRGPRALEIPSTDRPTGHGFRVRTFRFAPDVVFHRGRLLAALAASEAERIKGVFRTDEGTIALQRAGGVLSEEPSGRRSDSRADVIASTERPDVLVAMEQALGAARTTPEEQQRRGTTLEIALPDGRVHPFDRSSLSSLPSGIPDVSVLLPDRQGAAARLVEILRAAGAPADGEAVVVAADGFTTTPVPIQSLAGAVLLHSIGDAALPSAQGGPFRMLIPATAADASPCANVKGVVRIAVRGTS